jgi:general secretion pathway protein G
MQNSKLKFKVQNFNRGFTLIELLVVIVILGLLTAFLVANFVGVKQRARDGQRKSDLRNIQAALEIYRSDTGSYADSLPNCGDPWAVGGEVYMQTVPCDPLESPPYPQYKYTFTNGSYVLIGCLENTNDSQKDIGSSSPCDTANWTNWSYTLKNP